VFVQTIEEEMVYITIPAGTKAVHVLDQTEDNLEEGITIEEVTFDAAVNVLAFYSCCKNKPHRF
jgi:hypothetical protein